MEVVSIQITVGTLSSLRQQARKDVLRDGLIKNGVTELNCVRYCSFSYSRFLLRNVN